MNLCINRENKLPCPAKKLTNVLVYSDNETSGKDLESILKDNLDSERYTVYNISEESLAKGAWKGTTALFVLAGAVGSNGTSLLEYFLKGGRILALHSDLISTIIPYYKTDNRGEMVKVTFDDAPTVTIKNNSIAIEQNVRDIDKYLGHDMDREINIEIKLREDTNNSPAIIKLTDSYSNGIAVFTSLFLEANYTANIEEEEEEQTNNVRMQIFCKLLNELGIHLKEKQNAFLEHTMGYLIGNNNVKESLIKEWCSDDKLILKVGYGDTSTTMQLIRKGEVPSQNPSKYFLPVHLDENPDSFSTEEYYRHLTTKYLGQVLIFADVLSTTMSFVKGPLTHGIAIVARQQLEGQGRGGNSWITPLGQAVISVQLSKNISPEFVSITQHVSALAAVLALRTQPYEDLDIRIKWPNDIYYGRDVKIGGTIANAMCMGNYITVNIGTGVNITNKVPTKCFNDIISEYNERNNTELPGISIEYFLARYLNELEDILESIAKNENVNKFLNNYYKYWLHTDEEVRVKTEDSEVQGTVVGVDTSGWLVVKTSEGDITVMPDGNTFDMMNGLIAPKFKEGSLS